MTESWGQQVVVDNRPGAGGIVASQVVVGSNPDGHTLMMVSNAHAISATLYSKLLYDIVRDFAGVSQVASGCVVVVVGKDLGVKSVKELIALAKSRPGKINFGTAGVGSAAHIHGEMFKIEAGIDIAHIAYKGPVEALSDTIAGRIGIALVGPGAAAPLIRDGRALALGVSTVARSPMLPNVPPEETLECYAKCGEPKKLVKLPRANHYDSYEFRNPEMSRIVYQEAAAWFKQYL